MIITLEKPVSQTVVHISPGKTGVYVRFSEHNETFRKIVKASGFSWYGGEKCWYRKLDEFSGPVPDRTIETAAILHAAGFVIETQDDLAERLASGLWLSESKRWLLAVGKSFGLRWRGQDDGLYYKALMLPESHWDTDSKSVAVPPLYYQEVQGFCEEHAFEISPDAKRLLDQAQREYRRMLIPEAAPAKSKPTAKKKRRFCDPAKFADIPEWHVKTLTALMPHQIPAVERVSPMRIAALFMDMGTGKTRCAIELVARRQARISKVIWFCPVGLKITIAAEIAKHTAGETVYLFDEKTTGETIPDAFWYIVGTESMSSSDRVVLAVKKLIDTDTFVIMDESSYIKGHASKRSMRIIELCRETRYRLLLTGTPISQGVEDLYAQMKFLSPDILGYGSFYSFARAHLEYSEKYPGLVVRSLAIDTIADRIAPYVYQVTKAECMTLPEKLYDRYYCRLTDAQSEAYFQAKTEILQDAEELDSYIIFKLFTALQQIVSGFWNREGELLEFREQRSEALITALQAISETEKVIIWCKFVYSLHKIASLLPGCALYYGELSEKERAAELEKFRGDGCRYLIATQATGGHGLTLNEAHYHIFYENEFKYAHRIQAEDRSHRIGQTQPVTYVDIISDSGIDSRIQAALSKKQNVVQAFRKEVRNIKELEGIEL